MNRRLAAVTAIAVAATLVLTPDPATAEVVIADVGLRAEYERCKPMINAVGLNVLKDIERSGKKNKIVPGGNGTMPDDLFAAIAGNSTGGTFGWDPMSTALLEPGVTAESCATLVHEGHHLRAYNNGTDNKKPCLYTKDGVQHDTGIPVSEVLATYAENAYRHAKGLPVRKSYLGKPLPPDNASCDKEEQKPKRRPNSGCSVGVIGANCGGSTGDPHLRTFDGLRYSFMAAGEFTLAKSTVGGLTVQSRQTPFPGYRVVTVNTAVAADVAGDRIGVYLVDTRVSVRLNGSVVTLPASGRDLPKGGAAGTDPDGTIWVVWPDGALLEVRPIGPWGLGLSVALPATHRGKVEGLLGNFDGKPSADLVRRGGSAVSAAFSDLYPGYSDSWRISQSESLFDYAAGQSTATFTDKSLPERPIVVADLPNRATAEVVCRQAGVTDPDVLAGCVADVAFTGQRAFAADAAIAQRADAAAGDVTLAVTTAGGSARTTVAGRTGQRLFVDAVSTTLPDECGVLSLRSPGGQVVATGCVIRGSGYIDGTVLPETGEYTVVVDPGGSATGRTVLRLSTSTDEEWEIGADGPAGTATIAAAGALSRARFTGKAGQKVFVDATSLGLPDQCGVLLLRGPADEHVAAGCLIGGRGFIDGTVLPAAGRYTIVVDAGERAAGSVQLRLLNAPDQEAPITVDGPEATAVVARPGAVTRLRFDGTAGQRVSVTARGSTLPDHCGLLELRDPAGNLVTTGCVIGGSGSIAPTALPVSGRYTLVVNPAERDVGRVTVALRR